MDNKETVRVSTFKKWPFAGDFSYEYDDDKVSI